MSILDVGAAALVVIAILLPARSLGVHPAYPEIDEESQGEISRLQARLARHPGDGAAAEELGDLLAQLGYTEWALRTSGVAAAHEQSATLWRAYRSLSTTHADRIEIEPAYRYAAKAKEACQHSADCPNHEFVRLEIYSEQLQAGLASGIDPLADPYEFRAAISRAGVRQVRVLPPSHEPEPSPEPAPAPEPEVSPAPGPESAPLPQ